MVKVVKTDLIQELLQQGKRDLSVERAKFQIQEGKVGISSQGAGLGVGGWKITEKPSRMDSSQTDLPSLTAGRHGDQILPECLPWLPYFSFLERQVV